MNVKRGLGLASKNVARNPGFKNSVTENGLVRSALQKQFKVKNYVSLNSSKGCSFSSSPNFFASSSRISAPLFYQRTNGIDNSNNNKSFFLAKLFERQGLPPRHKQQQQRQQQQLTRFSTSRGMRSLDSPPGMHINTEWNNEDTPFDFTPASYKEIFETLAKYPPQNKQSGILPLLHLAQRQCGGLKIIVVAFLFLPFN